VRGRRAGFRAGAAWGDSETGAVPEAAAPCEGIAGTMAPGPDPGSAAGGRPGNTEPSGWAKAAARAEKTTTAVKTHTQDRLMPLR